MASTFPTEFYAFYQEFGPGIGRFYTVLTIIAALIPIGFSMVCFRKKSTAFRYALTSAIFALLFIACFYIYFKSANDLFYQAALSETDLKTELMVWSKWHWSRIGLEFLSLVFLILHLKIIRITMIPVSRLEPYISSSLGELYFGRQETTLIWLSSLETRKIGDRVETLEMKMKI